MATEAGGMRKYERDNTLVIKYILRKYTITYMGKK